MLYGAKAPITNPRTRSDNTTPMGLKRLLAAPKDLFRRARASLRHTPKTSKRMIIAQDVFEIFKLAGQGVLAWSLPESAWWPISRLFARLDVAAHRERTGRETAKVAALIAGTAADGDPLRIVNANWANVYGERFQYLRAWRPGGWSPEIDIVGADHVSAALARGRGIVFWGGNFSFNNLIAKIAMRHLGLGVVGFSIPLHGVSKTVFGVRYLNQLYRNIEDRYLGERLMAEPPAFPAALQRMRECLEANGTVYFAVGGRGRRTASAKFLGARLVLATAPLAMAHTTGAAMLPIYTLRLAPRRYEVTFGPPLGVPMNEAGNPDYAAAVQAYADTLSPFVLRDPEQWRAWRLMNPAPPWGTKRSRTAEDDIE